jgi:hypothetical protein
MTDPEEITGRWWIHGDSSPPMAGVLSQEGGSLSLRIVNTAGGESVARLLTQGAQVGLPAIPNVIRGRDSQDKPVTLFGCFCESHSTSQGEEVYEIAVLAGVQGCDIESWKKPVVRTVFVRLQHFHRWLEMDVLKSVPLPDGKTGWKACEYSEILFPIAEGIDFRITQSLRHKQGQDGDEFRPECKICLSFANPRSMEEVCEKWTHWIAHFFSLLVGTSLRLEEIMVSEVDLFSLGKSIEDAVIYFGSQAKVLGRTQTTIRTRLSDPNPYDMAASYSSVRDQLGTMLQRWHAVSERLDPVVGLFTSVVFHHALYSTAEFLFLVQALEVYHTRSGHFESYQLPPDDHKKKVEEVLRTVPTEHSEWVRRKIISANYKYLNERLLAVFQANESLAKGLFHNLEETSEKIAYTRNHYTHYTSGTGHQKFIDQDTMAQLNFSLEHFLWALLLKEIGAPESAGHKIIRTAERAKFTTLTGPMPPEQALGIQLEPPT